MNRLKIVLVVAIALACCSDAQARWRPFRRSSGSYSASVSFSGGPQAVASAKASRAAARGNWHHQGGSFGGAHFEGVGFSSVSASAALSNCCYSGRKTIAGQSVVRGRNGWYAVRLYW